MMSLFLSLLSVAALTIIALMIFIWIVALLTDDASVIDLVWGLGFALVAIVCAVWLNLNANMSTYLWVLTMLPIVWAIRYSTYIFWRNIGHGEDPRYTKMREGKSKATWPFHLLFKIYGFQALAMLIVALPIVVGMASGTAYETKMSIWAVIGATICLFGIVYEGLADIQLAKFKYKRKALGPEVTGKVMDKGLWRYSRHPNYFGNATLWWGYFIIVCSTAFGALSAIGPLFMTYCLIRVSGADHLEKTLSQRPEYVDYMQRTSKFFPQPPKPKPYAAA